MQQQDLERIRVKVRERLAAQRALVAELLRLRAQLAGSLFARFATCGKPGCACRRGRRHGPYYVLSDRSGGRGGFAYLDRGAAREARALVSRHRRFRRGMRQLQRTNASLVALLRRYQAAGARRARARLGLALSA